MRKPASHLPKLRSFKQGPPWSLQPPAPEDLAGGLPEAAMGGSPHPGPTGGPGLWHPPQGPQADPHMGGPAGLQDGCGHKGRRGPRAWSLHSLAHRRFISPLPVSSGLTVAMRSEFLPGLMASRVHLSSSDPQSAPAVETWLWDFKGPPWEHRATSHLGDVPAPTSVSFPSAPARPNRGSFSGGPP